MGSTSRVSVSSTGTESDGESFAPALSGDGRYVAYVSHATNVVPGDANATEDIYVHVRQSRTTRRISVSSAGAEANGRSLSPAITADGRYVAFGSFASNLVPSGASGIFVRDLRENRTDLASVTSTGVPAGGDLGRIAAISGNGRFVAFVSYASNLVPDDGNRLLDVFERSL